MTSHICNLYQEICEWYEINKKLQYCFNKCLLVIHVESILLYLCYIIII